VCREIDPAESRPATGDSLALMRAVTLHEDQLGSPADNIVDGAGRVVINVMLDCVPYGSVQVVAMYIELSTQ
jgi:hypothetical protein